MLNRRIWIREKNKAIKKALLTQIKGSEIEPETVAEWLWEDFGKRVKPDWSRIEKAILSDETVTPQDMAVFMIENNVFPDEGAWDAMPVRGLRGIREDSDDS
jgi:hypothetical protein